MKLTNNQKLLLGVLVILGFFYYFQSQGSSSGSGGFTVYGTDWCGFTTKQRKHLDTKYGSNSHTYVNCDKDKSKCQGMTAFPVTTLPSGKKVSGFNTTI